MEKCKASELAGFVRSVFERARRDGVSRSIDVLTKVQRQERRDRLKGARLRFVGKGASAEQRTWPVPNGIAPPKRKRPAARVVFR